MAFMPWRRHKWLTEVGRHTHPETACTSQQLIFSSQHRKSNNRCLMMQKYVPYIHFCFFVCEQQVYPENNYNIRNPNLTVLIPAGVNHAGFFVCLFVCFFWTDPASTKSFYSCFTSAVLPECQMYYLTIDVEKLPLECF